MRLAERGDAIVAAHDGRSRVETYLVVVIARLLHDWQRSEWGSWRPSAEALRLGDLAIALEKRWGRDGLPFDQVAAELRLRFGARAASDELERIRRRLPARSPRSRPADPAAASGEPSHDTAEAAVLAREGREVAERLLPLLQAHLGTLEPDDRLLLILVFREGLSVRAAARALGLEHKRVGRRLAGVLGGLRRHLEEGGVDRHGVLLLLESPEGAGDAFFRQEDRDNPPSRPSNREMES